MILAHHHHYADEMRNMAACIAIESIASGNVSFSVCANGGILLLVFASPIREISAGGHFMASSAHGYVGRSLAGLLPTPRARQHSYDDGLNGLLNDRIMLQCHL